MPPLDNRGFVKGLEWDMPNEQWQPGSLSIWSSQEPGSGADSRKLLQLFDARIKVAIQQCNTSLDKDRVQVNVTCMKTLPASLSCDCSLHPLALRCDVVHNVS